MMMVVSPSETIPSLAKEEAGKVKEGINPMPTIRISRNFFDMVEANFCNTKFSRYLFFVLDKAEKSVTST